MRTVLYGICLFIDNGVQTRMFYSYETERRGKRARCQRDRQRECVREGGWMREEVASVVKMTVEEN